MGGEVVGDAMEEGEEEREETLWRSDSCLRAGWKMNIPVDGRERVSWRREEGLRGGRGGGKFVTR